VTTDRQHLAQRVGVVGVVVDDQHAAAAALRWRQGRPRRLRWRRFGRQQDGHAGSPARTRAVDVHRPAVQLDEALDRRQAQPQPAARPVHGLRRLHE
jgi:hypothetical protein